MACAVTLKGTLMFFFGRDSGAYVAAELEGVQLSPNLGAIYSQRRNAEFDEDINCWDCIVLCLPL